MGSGQVLECPYDFVRTRLVVREMADQLALSLVESRLVTRQIVLTVGYDIENLTDKTRSKAYHGEVKVDGKFQSTRMVRRICRGIPHPLCSLWMQ